jgi:methionyl-tRNA formyltransferase
MSNPIKVIFAGTPEFAVPYLEGLFNDQDFSIIGVLTQPDKPVGRKQELTPSPIKVLAERHNLNIWQPEKICGNVEVMEQLKKAGADVLVVVAYGQILPQELLDLFSLGAINVHPSLLPKYRGASPVQSAVLNGDEKTGISIMLMDEKMDHGPILIQEEISLNGTETSESLLETLSKRGVPLLIESIKKYSTKEIVGCEQKHELATFCRMINKEEARIDWDKSAQEINNAVRGFYAWPIAWTTLNGQRFKIFPPVEAVDGLPEAEIGQIRVVEGEILVQCGKDVLKLNKVQLEGKKEMTAKELLNGLKDLDGSQLK